MSIRSLIPSLVLILVVAGLGVYFFQDHVPWDKLPPQLQQQVAKISSGVSGQLPADTNQQVEILSERAQTVSGHVQQVLGESVQVSEEKKPIHQRAYEYTRYQYCLQVVKDFEQAE